MTGDQSENLLPNEQDMVTVYINPEVMQSLADRSAEKRQSFRELQDAAQEGNLDAAYQLARRYLTGSGTPADEKEAFYWLTRAAEGDHIAAQYDLGMCYARGVGTEADLERAAELFAEGARQGYPPAACELGLGYGLSCTGRPPSRTTPPPSATWGSFTAGALPWRRTAGRRPCGLPSPPNRAIPGPGS